MDAPADDAGEVDEGERATLIDLHRRGARLRSAFDLERDARAVTDLILLSNGSADLDGLAEFSSLTSLRISGRAKLPDNVSFPRLRYYDGPLEQSVLRSPMLRELLCTESRTPMPAGLEVAGPVERFYANGDGGQAHFPEFAVPEALLLVNVAFYESLDLRALDGRRLRQMILERIARVLHVDRLANLPNLEKLALIDVGRVEPAQSAPCLRASSGVSVSGRHRFDPETRRTLRALGWTFPPSERMYVSGG
ncbi:hypothetical protein FQ330_12725 [Agrococcus sediminis]|uniref:Uncharacterized protein n=1 Tax=Agrococcus sediminis TaxID=2599924 RepID=A0A5M8Q6R4_9MICO|nr:hypothetical protein [Agrococcus sediminis]KAA6430576.1 hypothetical protein FQ330_12725 [Agrococcus sediminis]